MKAGDNVSAIELGVNEKGEKVRISDFKGKKLVLYFYPKDMTSGCPAEACSLRDNYDEFRKSGYEIVGVSVDSGESHKKFIEKYSLPFQLIADTDKKLVQEFGVWGEKKMYGRTYYGTIRTTYIIDENGVIEKVFTSKEINTKTHGAQILA